MQPATSAALIELNRKFYADFGAAFAATRRRIQPGVARVLDALPDEGRWLDLGCGSGSLAVEWLRRGRSSAYHGLDFSTPLLDEARAAVRGLPGAERVTFAQADLTAPAWAEGISGPFRGALSFAVLHHLPGADLRARLMRQAAGLLPEGALLALSVWQFQHAPRLLARRQPWQAADIDPEDLEPGDTLLDWRYALPGQPERVGLRYVHLFEPQELASLAAACGCAVAEEFWSDGQGGRLGLYHLWRKLPGGAPSQPPDEAAPNA